MLDGYGPIVLDSGGKCEVEAGALSRTGFGPDFTSVIVHQHAANGQADAVAQILAAMSPIGQLKNFLRLEGWEAGALI
jgi:hypothetical protein